MPVGCGVLALAMLFFSFQEGEALPATEVAPFTIGLFLSHDPLWSPDDINLGYSPSTDTADQLKNGMADGKTKTIQEFVKGLQMLQNFKIIMASF